MTFHLHLSRPLFLVTITLSTILSLIVIGCAGDVLRVYRAERGSEAWWLPIWPAHFDSRGVETLIGMAVGVVLLNAVGGVVDVS